MALEYNDFARLIQTEAKAQNPMESSTEEGFTPQYGVGAAKLDFHKTCQPICDRLRHATA